MPYTLSILKVEDYARWKSDWDSEDSIVMRKGGGQGSFQIFHTEDDPNNLVLLIEMDNLDNARKFVQSKELREAMQRSGVIGQGDHYFLKEVEKGTL